MREREGGRVHSHGVEELLVFIVPLVLTDQHVQLVYQLTLHLQGTAQTGEQGVESNWEWRKRGEGQGRERKGERQRGRGEGLLHRDDKRLLE